MTTSKKDMEKQKKDRLAAALRANLKKRKEQQRAKETTQLKQGGEK